MRDCTLLVRNCRCDRSCLCTNALTPSSPWAGTQATNIGQHIRIIMLKLGYERTRAYLINGVRCDCAKTERAMCVGAQPRCLLSRAFIVGHSAEEGREGVESGRLGVR